jgi:hypothetical protein
MRVVLPVGMYLCYRTCDGRKEAGRLEAVPNLRLNISEVIDGPIGDLPFWTVFAVRSQSTPEGRYCVPDRIKLSTIAQTA